MNYKIFLNIKVICFLLISLASLPMNAQFNNSWINFNQKYYKIKIANKGIYKITYQTLINAGINVSEIDPRSFQIFTRGIEEYILVQGEENGIFEPTEYIEFAADKNNGWFDERLYETASKQTNPFFSQFNDTAVYFLTWNSSINNRRITKVLDYNYSGYTIQPYVIFDNLTQYTHKYYYGEPVLYGYADPEFTSVKGWYDDALDLGLSTQKNISTKKVYVASDAPMANITIKMIGSSNYAQINPDHHLKIQFANQTIDTIYEGYASLTFSRSIPSSNLGFNSTNFLFESINNLNTNADRSAISYIKLKYPRTPDLDGANNLNFEVNNQAQGKTYLKFSNVTLDVNDSAYVYDFTNHKKIYTTRNNTNIDVLIPNGIDKKECILTSKNQIIQVDNLTPINENNANVAKFNNFLSATTTNSNYIIVTHNSLMDEANNYRNYREQSGYKPLLVDVAELYDQFAYGIVNHPEAIREFLKYIYTFYSEKPEYLLLIGKALSIDYSRHNPINFTKNLVPSYGMPCSDLLFSNQFDDVLYKPSIATGRISAKTPEQVRLYLDKVIQYEANGSNPEEWMKKILHFGGGSNSYEQTVLKNFLQQYEITIEDTLFGGNVQTFLKQTTAPIEENISENLKTIINNGVSLMTFFGHAAGIGWDISIDDPSSYDNYGKYPFLLSNSCFSGDIYGDYSSSSEEFVLIENKGVIGYLGSIIKAGPSELHEYSNAFYKNIGVLNYNKAVGKSIQNTIKTIQTGNIYSKGICLEMTLHGDPAIIINSQSKPDYLSSTTDVYFSPANVTSAVDTFFLNVIVTNIGKAVNEIIYLEVKRTITETGKVFNYYFPFPATRFRDTISVKIPMMGKEGTGINQFQIKIDYFDQVNEISEINNTINTTLIIKSADLMPVYPYRYAIVPRSSVTLKASTGYAFLNEQNYIFELDTNVLFNSPFKLRQSISQSGGIISWQPPVLLIDSSVYYWRVSRDSVIYGSYNWRESSFQYIPEQTGWSQAHFHQFKDDKFQYVKYNFAQRRFDFANNIINLYASTGFYNYTLETDEQYRINNVQMDAWSCVNQWGNGLKFAVFDPISFTPWYCTDHGYGIGADGNCYYRNYDVPAFDFFTDDGVRDSMIRFINKIPENYYVLVFNHRNHNFPYYGSALQEAFKKIGCTQFSQNPILENGKPYILFGVKKNIAHAQSIEIAGNLHQKIELTVDTITTRWQSGFIESEVIGPATNWKTLRWKSHPYENLSADTVKLNVIGIKSNGQTDTLIFGLSSFSGELNNLENLIDANIYPQIKLNLRIQDNGVHTPTHLDYWQVLYDPIPETALNPKLHFSFYKDTLQEGDYVKLSTAIHNISEYNMDSLLVKYWIIDKDRNTKPVITKKLRKHPAGDILIDSVSASTRGLIGANSLWLEVNPDNNQPEQYHFNNLSEIYFVVQKDITNPLLDLTFDGVHILDGDIVSAKPQIQISLKDENKFLALNDTSLFKVFLSLPNQTEPTRIYFSNNGKEIMRFIPAKLPNNSCKIEYDAEFPIDGTYKISVQAKDFSANASGDYNYEVSFKVINKSTITEIMNWPNPFSTSTRFVFTLTGYETPTVFKIQIMTISGKLVREIMLDELGPIHIGRNITQFAWDGTDEFGDKLANGVYLYRIQTEINGINIEKNKTSAQKYFTKDFGKMVIIR